MKGIKIIGNLQAKMNGRSFQSQPKIVSLLTCNVYSDVALCPDTLHTMHYTPQHYLFKLPLYELYCVC